MKRRTLLKHGLNSIAVSTIGLASMAKAEVSCTRPNFYGIQSCRAGLAANVTAQVAAAVGGQHLSQWCWAACIEMVFKFHDLHISQTTIVQDTWGSIVNLPAQPYQILNSINKTWVDANNREFYVSGDSYSANPITAAQDLANNNPLIIGTQGHAMVLYGLDYNRDYLGRGQVTAAHVIDPWPYSPRFRVLSANDWYSATFLARIKVARGPVRSNPVASNAFSDSVFRNIEQRYSALFPRSSTPARSVRQDNGAIAYIKSYNTGNHLAEFEGDLYYYITAEGMWLRWDAITKWVFI